MSSHHSHAKPSLGEGSAAANGVHGGIESVVIPKLGTRLDDSTLSLKKALHAVDECREEKEREKQLAKEEQEALKAERLLK